MTSFLLPVAVGALVISLLMFFLSRRVYISLRLGGMQKTLLLLLVLALGAAALYFPRIANEKALLARAPQHFVVTRHGSIEQKRVDYTLIQLERGLNTFQSAAGSKGFSPIKVELYPGVAQLQSDTGLEDWAIGFTKYTAEGPVIYLAAAADESGVEETPEHEVIHALFYQRLGQAYVALPDWFSEGTAQYYSMGGWARLPARDAARLGMWRQKDMVFSAAEFQAFSTDDASTSDEDVFFFYDCAYEFTRYLCRQSGEECITAVLDGLAAGSGFSQALAKATGRSCDLSYAGWTAEFWGPAP
jgi:hypothetical protein